MELKSYFAQDNQGNIIPLPTAYLYQPGTETLATGLQDATGAPLPNPFTGNIVGHLQFAAPNGDYDFRVVGAGRDLRMRVRFIDAARGLDIDPREFGAVGDGEADDTAAIQAACDLSRTSGRAIGAPGRFNIVGTVDPKGATFRANAQQYGRENVSIADWGMVLQHANPDGPMFAPTGGEFMFDGVVFYDPLQPGGALVVRPPMFDLAAPYHAVDVDFLNNVIVNAYDFFHSDAGTACGDWRVKGNRGYCVRFVWDFEGIVPEVVFATDNIWSPGVWQSGAIGVNAAQLAKWTALNGAVLHVNTGAGSVDGWKSDNEFVFGFFNHVRVSSGLLNVSTFGGYSWDQVAQPIRTEGNGGIVANFGTASKAYCLAYGSAATNVPAIYLHGTGVYNLSLDVQGQFAAGKWFEIITAGTGSISISGSYAQWGNATGAANVNCADIEAPFIVLSFKPDHVISSKTDQIGINIADIRSASIAAMFGSCALAVNLGACPTAYMIRDDSMVFNTGGSSSWASLAGAKFTAAGTYDKP